VKHCIWCKKYETETPFLKAAHTIPQSLGGKEICVNVCDHCNQFFGQHYNGYPSVETIIKEAFGISRVRLLEEGSLGKNKPIPRFSSIYFKLDIKRRRIELKNDHLLKKGFPEIIGRQIKKGLYKIFLEEIERQKCVGHNPEYNFIRSFCRYDEGDCPVIYFQRRLGIIATSREWTITPKLFLDPDQQFKYLVREPSFFEFEFLGHVFAIATTDDWKDKIEDYIKKTSEAKKNFFEAFRFVEKFNDIDLALSILDDK
jgi:hypothetical protein